jgi:hypothetical protein
MKGQTWDYQSQYTRFRIIHLFGAICKKPHNAIGFATLGFGLVEQLAQPLADLSEFVIPLDNPLR